MSKIKSMYRSRILLGATTLVVMLSCSKNSVDPKYGEASVQIDSIEWSVDAEAKFMKNFGNKLIVRFGDKASITKRVSIGKIPLKEGFYSMAHLALSQTTTDSVYALLIFSNQDACSSLTSLHHRAMWRLQI